MNRDQTTPTVDDAALMAALDAGIEAANANPGADPATLGAPKDEAPADDPKAEVLATPGEATPEPKADETPAPAPKDEAPAPTPDGETPEAKAEREADEAAATEARALGFKNDKGVKAYQDVHRRARTAETERDTFKAQVEEFQPQAQAFVNFREHMQRIGTQPEQFGVAVALIEAVNSGDPAKLVGAEQELENQLRFVREKLGRGDGVDLVAKYPDLLEEVKAGDLTRKRAEELAGIRHNAELATKHANATQTTQTRTEETRTAAINEAVADLDALGVELQRTDPHFATRSQAALVEFKKVRDQTPPAKWEATYLRLYQRTPIPAPPAPKPTPGHVPLRGSGVTGPSKVATTAMEALDAGLEAANKGATW